MWREAHDTHLQYVARFDRQLAGIVGLKVVQHLDIFLVKVHFEIGSILCDSV